MLYISRSTMIGQYHLPRAFFELGYSTRISNLPQLGNQRREHQCQEPGAIGEQHAFTPRVTSIPSTSLAIALCLADLLPSRLTTSFVGPQEPIRVDCS